MTFSREREAVLAARHAISEIFELAEIMPACTDADTLCKYGREINTLVRETQTLKEAHAFLSTQRGETES